MLEKHPSHPFANPKNTILSIQLSIKAAATTPVIMAIVAIWIVVFLPKLSTSIKIKKQPSVFITKNSVFPIVRCSAS